MSDRPTAGEIEVRTTGGVAVDGRRIRGVVPYGVESRDLGGGWREVIEPTAFRNTDLSELRATIDHKGVPLGRYPHTLEVEDGDGGLHWALDPPRARQDVVEAVERGDMRAGSWRMVVGKDRWQGDVRHVEEIRELLDVCLVGAEEPAYPASTVELRTKPINSDGAEERQKEVTMETSAQRSSEERTNNGSSLQVEDRDSGGGSLMVEDRSQRPDGERTVEQRIVEELLSVRPGESRALTTAVSISPGELSTTLFDRLRAASVVLATGIVTLTTESDSVSYPRLTADVTPTWTAEAAAIPPGDPTLDTITATPRKLAHLTQFSNEVFDDSDPSITEVLNTHLLAVLALKLDQGLLEGTGTAPEIRGLKNIVGIQSVAAAANGQAPTFDNVADAIALLEAVNVPLQRMALIVHPRNVATLRKAKSSGGGEYLWSSTEPASAAPTTVFGVRVFVTPQLSTNETEGTSGAVANSAYLIDTGALVFVQRTPIEIELDRSRLFNSDQSEMRAKLRGDLIAPNPTGVVRIRGLLA